MNGKKLYVWKDKITTIGFIAINVFLFVVSMFSGDLLYREGAFSLQYIQKGQEWWRLVTSMFLHADLDHLFGNMLMLYLAGELVERYIGKWNFAILYFCSGISGSLLYAGYEFFTGNHADSIGASGAVFGVVGALLVIVISHKGKYGNITIGRMAFMIFYMGYMGLRASNVNNAAHVGGALCGIVLTAFYMLTRDFGNERRQG